MWMECWNLTLLAWIVLKWHINTTKSPKVVDYPDPDPFLRTIRGHLADVGAVGKLRTAPGRNNASSAHLYRSKENNCLSRELASSIETQWRYSIFLVRPSHEQNRVECVNDWSLWRFLIILRVWVLVKEGWNPSLIHTLSPSLTAFLVIEYQTNQSKIKTDGNEILGNELFYMLRAIRVRNLTMIKDEDHCQNCGSSCRFVFAEAFFADGKKIHCETQLSHHI